MKIQSILILATLLPTPLLAFEDTADAITSVFSYQEYGSCSRLNNLKNNDELKDLVDGNPCLKTQLINFDSYVAHEFPKVVSAMQEIWGDNDIQGLEFDQGELQLEYLVRYNAKELPLDAWLALFHSGIGSFIAMIDIRFSPCCREEEENGRYFLARLIPWSNSSASKDIYYNVIDPRDGNDNYDSKSFESEIKNSTCTILSNEVLRETFKSIVSRSIKILKEKDQN